MFENYVIFDGECGFCNKTVMFLAKKDLHNKFVFISNVSYEGKRILGSDPLLQSTIQDSIIIIAEDGKTYTRERAFLFFFKQIPKLRLHYYILKGMPFKNWLYRIVAKIRQKLPVKNSCAFNVEADFSKKFIH